MKNDLKDLPPLDPDDYKPLYAQLSDAIIQYIQNRRLKPGDSIPSESDLIHYYGISRMTVRLAIQRLATEGLIIKLQGKGTFVAESKVTDVIRGVRSLEETLSEQGIHITNILIESSVEHPTQLWLKELGLPAGSRTHKIRRLKQWAEKPLCIEVRNFPLDIAAKFYPEQLNTTPAVVLMNSQPETEVHYVNYRIISAVLLEREAEVMQAPVDTPVLIQFMTHYNAVKKPIMTGRLTFLAETVEVRFEFNRNGQTNRWLLVKQ
ncbi:MAG: GntR family transcriptional regulator [Deltaproteobacteria bacterium]|nr:GntR family transcriptional regulator [Deltaproteobacteria bacterium]